MKIQVISRRLVGKLSGNGELSLGDLALPGLGPQRAYSCRALPNSVQQAGVGLSVVTANGGSVTGTDCRNGNPLRRIGDEQELMAYSATACCSVPKLPLEV